MVKKVSIEIVRDTVEGPAHRTELALRQTTKANEVPAEYDDSAQSPLVELEAIKEKVESTRVENGKVEKVQVGND